MSTQILVNSQMRSWPDYRATLPWADVIPIHDDTEREVTQPAALCTVASFDVSRARQRWKRSARRAGPPKDNRVKLLATGTLSTAPTPRPQELVHNSSNLRQLVEGRADRKQVHRWALPVLSQLRPRIRQQLASFGSVNIRFVVPSHLLMTWQNYTRLVADNI